MNNIKLIFISIIIAVFVGIITYIFGTLLNLAVPLMNYLFPYNLILIPTVLYLITFLIKTTPDLNGSMTSVFNSTQKSQKSQKLNILIIPFQLLTTLLSHLAGASVGREGVAVQLGVVASNNLSKIFKNINLDHTTYSKLGMIAGFSGLFGTPIAAIFFCIELTNTKYNNYKFIFMAIITSFISTYTSTSLGLHHFTYKISLEQLDINMKLIFVTTISSFIFIFIGILFVKILTYFKTIIPKLFPNIHLKIIIMSTILIILMLLTNGNYMSLGTNLIQQSFNDPTLINPFSFLIKLLLTTLSISIGFMGGEVTPIFSIGATLGVSIASIFNVNTTLIAALGYSCVFANATRAYLAGFFICLEIFGLATLPFILICIGISKLLNKKYSIYPIYS